MLVAEELACIATAGAEESVEPSPSSARAADELRGMTWSPALNDHRWPE